MSKLNRLKRSVRGLVRPLADDTTGVAMVEFAFVAPLILTLGLGGMELANLAATHMRISQTAMQVADNASRIGDRNALAAERIFETDIYDLLIGAKILAGSRAELFEKGRVIISSLEQNDDGGQWIHWQRCMGKLNKTSAYGPSGAGEGGDSFDGMGIAGEELTAPENGAVMYVEIFYTYKPIVSSQFASQFVNDELEIRSEAAFTVRGSRDLSGVNESNGVAPATCDKLEAI